MKNLNLKKSVYDYTEIFVKHYKIRFYRWRLFFHVGRERDQRENAPLLSAQFYETFFLFSRNLTFLSTALSAQAENSVRNEL